jgi:RimJ/RimL family protein N-acetyltransferase
VREGGRFEALLDLDGAAAVVDDTGLAVGAARVSVLDLWRAAPTLPTVSTVFTTARLSVRPFARTDAGDAFAMWSDPEVGRFTGDDPPSDIAVIIADIERWQTVAQSGPGCGFWAVTGSDNRLLGDVYVRPIAEHPGEHEIGWHFARPHWGQGYATEAAIGALAYAHGQGIVRLVASIDPAHTASIRVAEKAGMTFEGISGKYEADGSAGAVFSSGG